MLIFGNETGKGKKGRGKPGSGHRPPRIDADVREGQYRDKEPSPPNMFVPVPQDTEALRLPRLSTPKSGFEEQATRDRLRPVQEPLQPLTHRGRIETDGAENRHENRTRPSSSSPEPAATAIAVPGGTPGRTKAYEEGDKLDSRSGASSRADGRAWEDSTYDNPKDPILNAFREMRLDLQVLVTKPSKDAKVEAKALETRLKRLEAQVMSDRQALLRRGKAAKQDTGLLQQNLKAARDNMQATMQQAAGDVIALTQKLQDVEDKFAQCRVDKEHLERSFASEIEVLRKKVADTEDRLETAHRENDEMATRMRDDREETRKLRRAVTEEQATTRALEEQLETAAKEALTLKAARSQLERQVAQLQADVQEQKGNVRNEQERIKMEKDRHQERVKSLESQLERCMQESSALDEYKTEAQDARRKLEQAESLLDETEAVRKQAVQHAKDEADKVRTEMADRMGQELTMVKAQLASAVQEKKDAAARSQQAHAQVQGELATANRKAEEANAARVAAQEDLRKQTDALLEQLQSAQQDSAKHMQAGIDSAEELLKCKAAAQEREVALKEEALALKLEVRELGFAKDDLQAQADRVGQELAVCKERLRETSDLLSDSSAKVEVDALKKLLQDKDRQISDFAHSMQEAEARTQREREEARKARDAMHEALRKHDSIEDRLARLQAEKEVCEGMVHQLMAQLSRARLDQSLILKGKDATLSVQEQHAQLQQLLVQAKAQSHQMDALVGGVVLAKEQAVKKYMTDLESSRASSRMSQLLDDEPRSAARTPGPAEAALQAAMQAAADDVTEGKPPSPATTSVADSMPAPLTDEAGEQEAATEQAHQQPAVQQPTALGATSMQAPDDSEVEAAAEGERVMGNDVAVTHAELRDTPITTPDILADPDTAATSAAPAPTGTDTQQGGGVDMADDTQHGGGVDMADDRQAPAHIADSVRPATPPVQGGGGGGDFAVPKPPTSRPTSARPTSAALRGSRPSSRTSAADRPASRASDADAGLASV